MSFYTLFDASLPFVLWNSRKLHFPHEYLRVLMGCMRHKHKCEKLLSPWSTSTSPWTFFEDTWVKMSKPTDANCVYVVLMLIQFSSHGIDGLIILLYTKGVKIKRNGKWRKEKSYSVKTLSKSGPTCCLQVFIIYLIQKVN